MGSRLDRLTLKQRLAVLVAVPGVLTVLYSGYVLHGTWQASAQVAAESRTVTDLSQLAVATSAAVHELQKERGRSAGYLGSQGRELGAELMEQRRQADAALARLGEVVAATRETAVGQGVRSRLAAGDKRREGLSSIRARVQAVQIPAPEALGFYTSLIADYLGAVEQAALVPATGELVRRLIAYSSFLYAKENAGLERAVLSNVFGADRFTPALYRTLSGVAGREQTRMASFRTHARPDDVAAFEQIVSGPEVARVAEWRELAFARAETGGFGVRPGEWFDVATRRIDLMKRVEDRLSAEVLASASLLQRSSDGTLYVLMGLTTLTLAFGIGGATVVGRATSSALRAAAAGIGDSAEQVAAAAEQVSTSAQTLSEGATEQAASLEETSASMEEMASMTRRNAENSQEAARLMTEADTLVEGSNRLFGEMLHSMAGIRDSSDKMSRIIKTIDEIAFQTNILALNAAVEAARAGDAGMGFGVVADEVRSLAQRCAQAARDTASLIEESMDKAQGGSRKVEQLASSISSLTDNLAKVKAIVEQVSEASRQQTQGIDQVTLAMGQMEQVTQRTAASAEESAAASEELNAQAETTLTCVIRLESLVVGTRVAEGGARRDRGPKPRRAGPGQLVHLRDQQKATPRGTRSAAEQATPVERTGTFGQF